MIRFILYIFLSLAFFSCEKKEIEHKVIIKNAKDGIYAVKSNINSLTPLDEITFKEVILSEKVSIYDFKNVKLSKNQMDNYVIDIILTSKGTKEFEILTTKNIRKPLAIVIHQKVVSAPTVLEPIRGGKLQISSGNEKENKQLFDYLTK